MEDIEPKDEEMPAPASGPAPAPSSSTIEEKQKKVPEVEKPTPGNDSNEATEISNVLDKLESTSKNFIENFDSMLEKFKENNKLFLADIDLYKEKILSDYSKIADPNEKLSLKNKKLDSDSRFKNLTGKPIQLINKMIVLYTSLFDNVKSNMDMISHFLKLGKNLDSKKTLPEFFSQEFKNIVDSWLFMKLDFDNFNMNDALAKSDLDENFKGFIAKIYKKKTMSIYIEHVKGEIETEETKKKIEAQIKYIKENAPNSTKLTLKNTGDYSKMIERNLIFPKLTKFHFENGKIREQEFNIKDSMPELEKLTIKYAPNFEVYFLEHLPKNIKRLYLERCNFINTDFAMLMKTLNSFSYKKEIQANLEVLSLAGNNMTKVDFTNLNQKTIYQSLLELNFRNNKLYKFIYNPENFPKLKFINCSKNNFNKSYLKDSKILSLESGNGFLFEPELCKSYYDNLRKKICTQDDMSYVFDYLNISFMPKKLSIDYFRDFGLNMDLMIKLKKLDLSYNGLTCNTFFSLIEKNNNFEHLHSLNLNGNELDDTFFEKLMKNNVFPKLEHLYLNSNRIGDPKIKVNYKDDIPVQEKDKNLVYKLRLIFKFIEQTPHLSKLTITKNPISEFYTVNKGNNCDKSPDYIKRDMFGKIAINDLFSMLIKIRDELLTSEIDKEKRKGFNLKFDCRSNVNKNSDNYPYGDRPIVKKN